MTSLLFSTALFLGIGYIFGKLFKDLNPISILLGLVVLIFLAPSFISLDNDFYTLCLVIGGLLSFERPVTASVSFAKRMFESARVNMSLSGDINHQKKQAEDDLYRQKREVEEELKRQKAQAEEDINRQRREAEDALRKEKEQFKRSKKSHNTNSSNSSHDNRNLNPTFFSDACEILWMNQNATLQEYKKAYKRLISVYHPDKLHGMTEESKEHANSESKKLNVAIETIENHFKN